MGVMHSIFKDKFERIGYKFIKLIYNICQFYIAKTSYKASYRTRSKFLYSFSCKFQIFKLWYLGWHRIYGFDFYLGSEFDVRWINNDCLW